MTSMYRVIMEHASPGILETGASGSGSFDLRNALCDNICLLPETYYGDTCSLYLGII